jgi:hypothetical protein
MLIKRDYYTIDEVAEQHGASVEDLLMLGADGKLQFSLRLKTYSYVETLLSHKITNEFK